MRGSAHILLFVLLIAGCRETARHDNKSPDRIRIGVLNGPAAVSIIHMIDQGKLETGAIPLEFIIRSEPNQIKSLMFNEEIDFAFLPSTTAAILFNAGFKYQAVSVPLWGSMYLVGSDSSIRSPKDLRGKSIYQMGRGVVPDIIMRYILKENGLDPDKDIKIDYRFPSHIDLASAVKAGIAEPAILSEPQVSLIINQNPRLKILLDITREWGRITGDSIPFAQTMIMVNNSFSKANPLLVSHFLGDYRRNIDWINSNPGLAASLMVKHDVIPDSIAAIACIPRCNLRYSPASDEKKGILEFYNILFELNKDALGGKMPDENFFWQE